MRLYLAYALTELALSFVPGPAVFFVASQGTLGGARRGTLGALGIVVGNSVYFALSALGLGSLIVASSTAFGVLRWVGVAYLTLIGLRLVLRRNTLTPDPKQPPSGNAFVRGVVTQLANPKALIYFTVVLPPFVSSSRGTMLQFVVLGVTSALIEFPVLTFYGWIAGRMRTAIGRRPRGRDRIAGALLIGTGARLALVRSL